MTIYTMVVCSSSTSTFAHQSNVTLKSTPKKVERCSLRLPLQPWIRHLWSFSMTPSTHSTTHKTRSPPAIRAPSHTLPHIDLPAAMTLQYALLRSCSTHRILLNQLTRAAFPPGACACPSMLALTSNRHDKLECRPNVSNQVYHTVRWPLATTESWGMGVWTSACCSSCGQQSPGLDQHLLNRMCS